MELTKQISDLISPVLAAENIRLCDVEWLNEDKMQILRISITKADGTIDLDTCSEVTERLSGLLDAMPELDRQYYLEVCSPGAEKELKNYEDWVNAINQYVYVKLKQPKEGLSEVSGDLIDVNEKRILVRYKVKTRTKEAEIDSDNIALIRLAVKF